MRNRPFFLRRTKVTMRPGESPNTPLSLACALKPGKLYRLLSVCLIFMV